MRYSLLVILFLFGCEQPVSESDLKVLQNKQEGLAQPSPDNPLTFPDAHWPKKEYGHEWWYLTANLISDQGKRFSSQWTLFRTKVEAEDWYFAHGALADTEHHQSGLRTGRQDLGTVVFAQRPFTAAIDDWHYQAEGAELFPARLSFAHTDEENNHFAVDFTLTSHSPYFLQGINGFNPKHASQQIASHYYSQPFVEVDGQIIWQGETHTVTGQAWFDREWSSQFLAEDQLGWDWFSLRLGEDTSLMIYKIRSELEDFQYANLMFRNGSSRQIASELLEIGLLNKGDNYPEQFAIRIPSENIDIRVKVDNSEQVMRLGIEYFEGSVTVSGSHQGNGFLEMTGYGK